MSTIFSKIVAGDIPSYKVAETEDFLAFLDVFPIAKGHVLVIPKKEVNYIFDLDDETLAGLHLFAKIVANAMDKAIDCKRIGMAVVGLEVPHVHIHLIPINSVNDMDFSLPKLELSEEEFVAISNSIRAELT